MLFNHQALSCVTSTCEAFDFDEETAELAHFRQDCTYNVDDETYVNVLLND